MAKSAKMSQNQKSYDQYDIIDIPLLHMKCLYHSSILSYSINCHQEPRILPPRRLATSRISIIIYDSYITKLT